MKKKNLIKLSSLESNHFYIKKKSKKCKKEIKIKKFNPILKKHVIYKERKLN